MADVEGLRRQLGALAYDAAGLTPAAAPLVAALLSDLVRATDGYREQQARAGGADQAAQTVQYQVGAGLGAGGGCGWRGRPGEARGHQPTTNGPAPTSPACRRRCCSARCSA